MFRALIPPIFKSTRLCVTACGITHPRCCRPDGRQNRGCIIPQAVNTQSSALEDGRDQRPKHGELIGIINKPLLLHVVGVYIININDSLSDKYHVYEPSGSERGGEMSFNFISL